MVTNLPFNGTSGFKIRRPLITANGFTADLDPIIKDQFVELNALLGLRLFTAVDDIWQNGVDAIAKSKVANAVKPPAGFSFILVAELAKPVIPKRTTKDRFDNSGILNDLHNNAENESPAFMTIGDCIDKTNALASLKYDFQTQVTQNWNFYDYNTKAVLGYPYISDYLIAYAYFIKNITEVNGLVHFVQSHKEGAANMVNYAIISAARTTIQSESLNVPEAEVEGKNVSYNNELHPLILKINAANLSMAASGFKGALEKIVDDYIFNDDQLRIIAKANIGKIPDAIIPMLVKYIKNSPIKITQQNAQYFLPLFISQILGTTQPADTTEVDQEQSDKDFDVEFLEDDSAIVQVSASNVKCAAQLFYCMVLGEELDVFNVVNFFTHKYLIRGGIEIQDQRLRENLQLYVFSNKFTDASNGRITDRTRPAERQMFYRQVFNYGTARTTGDVIVNREFSKLWKVLMYESARYLERAQDSPNPDQYVSRQNVMQAVEDLQYNLSTHCTGMANVITPLIYNELNFVIKNILMHPEVTRQVVPVGGTWWRVVETLYAAMKLSRPKSTVLYNKAKLGQTILKSIAEYNPSTFENDTNYSSFISNVDAFITTQSIIQESLPGAIHHDEKDEEQRGLTNGRMGYKEPEMQAAPSTQAAPAKAGNDEWDF